MIRIALTSDLHVDHHPDVVARVAERLRRLAPDLAVVAGDVSHDLDAVEDCLARLAEAVPRLAFVPGNHDLWARPGGGPAARQRYEELLPAAARRAGAVPLTDEAIELGPLTVIGETGWFDYTLRNRAWDELIPIEAYRRGSYRRLRWNDRQHVRFADGAGGTFDDEALTGWMVARLERKLAAAAGRPTVVVTHHLPFAEVVASLGDPEWDFLNGFIGSARLGEAIAAAPAVTVVLSGHTHFARRALVDRREGASIACFVSPVGYPREYRRHGDLAARVEARVIAIDLDERGRPAPGAA